VESADQGLVSVTIESFLQAGMDLQHRLFGESDSQKSGGVKTLLNQVNDPFSENHGLAGAGHREHDHGTLPMGDGLCLLRVELNVFHAWTSSTRTYLGPTAKRLFRLKKHIIGPFQQVFLASFDGILNICRDPSPLSRVRRAG